MTKIAASIVENCDAIDRASSFSRENTWLVGRGRTYARRGAKEEAGEGIAIGRSGDQVVGARDATETCQYTFDHQACEFARRFSSVITVRNISYCSRVRVYIFLFLTLFFRWSDPLSTCYELYSSVKKHGSTRYLLHFDLLLADRSYCRHR